jgi:hypothetical protein
MVSIKILERLNLSQFHEDLNILYSSIDNIDFADTTDLRSFFIGQLWQTSQAMYDMADETIK